MKNLKLCTFNLRTETSEDGINMFTYRTPYIKEAIKRESPDIIGFQEVRPHMQLWLRETFPEYYVVGCGRGANYKDESNPVLFKKDKFDFLGYDVFWLSPTPFVPGSRYEIQSWCPRICVVVTLNPVDGVQPFRIYNTHLDHESDEARKQGIRAILERMGEDDKHNEYPCFLMGDLNAEPDSDTIRFINECQTKKFTELTADLQNTFHYYGRTQEKIDYIFSSGNVKCIESGIWDDYHNGVYLSDHYPTYAVVDVE